MQSKSLRQDGHAGMRRTLIRKNAGLTIPATALAGILLVLSCGDGTVEPTPAPPPPAPVATSVTVSPASATLTALGETTRLTAEVRDQNGQVMAGAAVAWASSDALVAGVDASGLVTAAANGSATITATAGAASGTAAVTVTQQVSAVAVSPAADTLVAFGDTVRLIAEATDANGHAVTAVTEFAWRSSDESVATADDSGLVTALANGTATITAAAGEASGGAAVTVMQTPDSVAVSPAAATIAAVGDTLRLSAEAFDANGHVVARTEFAWESSDESVAAVDDSGLVTGTGNGRATITVTAGSVSGTATVTVTQSLHSVAVAPAEVTIVAVGDTLRLSAEAFDANGHAVPGVEFAWRSSDESVATVSGSGLVTGTGSGLSMITATAGSATGTATVTVTQVVSTVSVWASADTLVDSDTLRFSAEAADANGHTVAGAQFAWTSGDTLVARVDDSGLVTALAPGNVEIIATSSGVSGRAALAVVAAAPTTVAVTPDTVALAALGQTAQLAAEVRDQVGRVMEGQAVTWTSGDTLVATVDSVGMVTAVGLGVATVNARAGEVSGEAVVQVMQAAGSVVVSPSADVVALGDTLRLTAEAFDENGHVVPGAAFTWSSSDESVVTVDASGLVRGVGAGRATIAAAVGNVRGTSEITVENPDRAALVALYEATDGPNWLNSDGWLTDAPLQDWYGVGTDAYGRVVRLDLSGRWDSASRQVIRHGLTGPIPPELDLPRPAWSTEVHQ